MRRLLAVSFFVSVLATGCSSSVRAPLPSAPAGASGSTRAAVTLTVTIPSRSTLDSARRSGLFVGSATNGATVAVTDHASGAALLTTAIDLSSTSQSCGVYDSQGDRRCSFSLSLAATAAGDSDDVAVSTYDTKPSGGSIPSGAKQLASGTVFAQTIVLGAANSIAISLDGIVASVAGNVARIVFPGGAGTRTRTFAFSGLDAAGETIVGTFAAPITLTVNDPAAHTTLGIGKATGSTATLGTSTDGDDVDVSYDGKGAAGYTTSIDASGAAQASSLPVVLFSVSGPAAYATASQTVSFTAPGQTVSLVLAETSFTGSFTESDTCAGIATVAIGAASGGSATATVTAGASGTCIVNFGDGNFAYPAISLDDAGSAADAEQKIVGDDVAKVVNQYNVPGGVVDLYYHGKTYTYYFGVADRTTGTAVTSATGFEIGSVTKSFTALDLTLAADYPALIPSVNPATTVSSVALGDAAATYVPLYPAAAAEATTATGGACPPEPSPTAVPPPYSATWSSVTLQDLADHTSTLPDQPPNIFGPGTLPVTDRPCYGSQILENYAETYAAPAGSTVGSSYLYSDIGFGLLGDALEGIYDADYFTLTKSLVLTPLGMTNTFDVSTAAAGYGSNYATPYLSGGETSTFRWPYNAWPAGGTLRSTGPDMLAYLNAALQLSTDAQIDAAMKTAQTPVPGVSAGSGIAQGLAWATLSLDATSSGKPFTVIEKDGATGGMTAWIGVVNPGSTGGVGVTVMVNEAGGGDIPTAVSPATTIGEDILRDVGP